ncbi:DinB family protein [Hyunsoonleella ulvae]|uniref:DinB family protein n=1 Tax=Hyunsoonleella ulvae TaxID=2799948 RepID=UPI0019394624|nr:DinB family protein [Hyunsoonleella ulvae]
MEDTIDTLKLLISNGVRYISNASSLELSQKSSLKTWSKKEILGHLIDSAINNLQRFTEIQFEDKPYTIRKYRQNELVEVNNYQNTDVKALLQLWLALNERIVFLMNAQNKNTLSYEVRLDDNISSNLKFLMEDYVVHLSHHLNQIIE